MTVACSRVLITGAAGFLGCRLAEHVCLGHGLAVRGAIHTPARAARLARLPVELVRIDLLDADSLARAVEGCDAVVHCAYGTEGSAKKRRAATGRGTGLLAEAALRAGVRRFVHISSTAVYGFRPALLEIDEDVRPAPTGHPYCDGKIEAERAVAAAADRGLPSVVLRPTNVFGPFSELFTVAPVRALREGRVALVGDGSTCANTLYVDNLVHAILRALESDRAVGETFIVSDGETVTWRELYEAYARTASPPWPVRSISPDSLRGTTGPRLRPLLGELAATARFAAAQPTIRSIGRGLTRLVPGGEERARRWLAERAVPSAAPRSDSGSLPSSELAALHTSGVEFRIEKARSLLGYDPPVPFDVAVRLTREWLRFARLA